MKNKKVMKRVLVIAIVAAVAAGGIGGGIYVQRSKCWHWIRQLQP